MKRPAVPVLLRIAVRNLVEHKTKTLILGILISLGVVVLMVGWSLMDNASLGIRRSFIDNYTGHLFVSGIAEGKVSLFGVESTGGVMEDTPVIPDFQKVKERVDSLPHVRSVAAQITGYASIGIGELPGRSFSILFGIEPEAYRAMFDSIVLVEGRYLEPGETGILMSRDRLEELEEAVEEAVLEERKEKTDVALKPGDSIRVTGQGNAGLKIREVPLVGIYEYRNASEGLGIDLISFIDAQTLRALKGMSLSNRGEVEVDEESRALLAVAGSGDLEDLFDAEFAPEKSRAAPVITEESLAASLKGAAPRRPQMEDTGAWNYLLVRLDNPRRMAAAVAELNRRFEAEGLLARAGDWEDAAGPFASTADVIRTVFNVAIAIVGIVALIIMMNTLVISIIERTTEIGTMRALGAQKEFIWRMFVAETLTICAVFGLVGCALALLTLLVLNLAAVPATNVFLTILFAGKELRPALSIPSLFASTAAVFALGLAAHLYPVSVALRIPPIRAMQPE